MNELIDMMRVAFASNFTWYLESHNYHWNVGSAGFPQYHKFLEAIYSDAQGAIDDYAEKVRQLGAFAQGTYPDIVMESLLTDPVPDLTDPVLMFTQLVADNDIMIAHLQDTYDVAGQVREYGIQNFLADRIDSHKQYGWQLRATLNQLP